MHGSQFAGVGNFNYNQTDGALNISEKKMQNAQVLGCMNVSLADAFGVQIAGVVNVVKTISTGLKF